MFIHIIHRKFVIDLDMICSAQNYTKLNTHTVSKNGQRFQGIV